MLSKAAKFAGLCEVSAQVLLCQDTEKPPSRRSNLGAVG